MQLSDEEIERLRRSGVRLDRDGRFWHEGGEVTHGGLRAAFWRWLDRNPDGRYVLRLDERRFVYLDVDDAPHLVRSLRWQGDRAFVLLADGSEEELAYDTVRLAPRGDREDDLDNDDDSDGDNAGVYCRVKGGRFDARLSTAAWGALADHITDEDGRATLSAAGARYCVV